MKELTEEKPEQNNGVKFESMNVTTGEIYPKKKNTLKIPYKKVKKIILFIIIVLIIISIIIVISKSSDSECEIGEDDKCLLCDNKRKNKCSKCNPGYKIVNGKCILNYSFKAVYHTYKNNEIIKIINNSSNLIYMNIDGNNIESCNYYNFTTSGNHTVFYLMNTTNLTSINSLFYRINKLIYIYFSEIFNSENITDMSKLFYGCASLKSINIKNLNTKNVNNMEYMFSSCSKLKAIEIDDYKFNTENVINMSNMFLNCFELTSLNISHFNTKKVLNMNKIFSGCSSISSIN